MSYEEKKLLYHLTSFQNISSIFQQGLLPRNKIQTFENIADEEIIEFRTKHNLTDYIPFHFFPKNPFDGRVLKDNPTVEFVYICIHRELARNENFLILPKHPMALTEFKLYTYMEGFNKIDWAAMDSRNYFDTHSKNTCMAECLSPFTIPPNYFYAIYVRENKIKKALEKQYMDIFKTNPPFFINVNPNLF